MKIIKEKLIYSGWSNLTGYTLQLDINGKKSTVNREIYDSGDGATALLYNPNKQTIILTKQFRLAAFLQGHPDGYLIEACAGMLDTLSPEEAIAKEIYEETGIAVKEIKYLFSAYATPGAHKEKISYFLAPYSESDKIHPGGGLDEEHEDIEVIELSYQEIINMYKKNEIEDQKTLVLIQHAMIEGII